MNSYSDILILKCTFLERKWVTKSIHKIPCLKKKSLLWLKIFRFGIVKWFIHFDDSTTLNESDNTSHCFPRDNFKSNHRWMETIKSGERELHEEYNCVVSNYSFLNFCALSCCQQPLCHTYCPDEASHGFDRSRQLLSRLVNRWNVDKGMCLKLED